MNEQQDVLVERVRDEGQWFDRGLRVHITRPTVGRSPGMIEKAVFGAYEVLDCTPEEDSGEVYLLIKLRRFAR